MNWHSRTTDEISVVLNTDLRNGLTEEKAEMIKAECGKNIIETEVNKKSILRRFFEQLNDVMIIILLASAAASFVVSFINGENDFADSLLIIMIVILNAVLGVIQENKAEKAIDELKRLSVPHARVLRNGHIKLIDSEDVVPGDLLVLEAGDRVAADARVISSANLKAHESALTGESVPVE